MSLFSQLVLTVLCLLAAGTTTLAQSDRPVLRMVYKDAGKPPYMQKAPDNSGLYADLVGEALRRIGYRLEILRVPKARAYLLLQRGEAELYPALLLNAKRGEFLGFLRNGLVRDEEYLGLTPATIAPLRAISDIRQHGLAWIYDRASATEDDAARAGVAHYPVNNLDLARAIELASMGRPVLYKVVDDDLSDYLDSHNLKALPPGSVRLHEGLFAPVKAPLYLGFSKASSLYQEEPNPSYNSKKPLAHHNYPVHLVAGSVPDRLDKALESMVRDGTVAALLRKYGL